MSGPLPRFQIDLLMVAERMERASRAAPPPPMRRRDTEEEEQEQGEGISRRDTAVEVLEDEVDGRRNVVRTTTGESANQFGLRLRVYAYFSDATLCLKGCAITRNKQLNKQGGKQLFFCYRYWHHMVQGGV